MTNDTTTLQGSLDEMKDQLIYELGEKGVTTSYDSTTGLLGLINKISEIQQGGGGQEIVSFDNITTEFNYTRKRGNYGFSVTIPSGVTSLGNNCFYYCYGLTSITIPSGVTSLGSDCFYHCDNLTSVTIPSGVISLGDFCFQYCSSLTNVTIPSGVTSLGRSCFRNCTNLTSVTIPSSVTSLGTYCFYVCNKLVDYQLYWETPPITWNANLMPNNTNTIFTIPNGTTANYVAKSFPSAKLVERSE